jgi:hypothetical protein
MTMLTLGAAARLAGVSKSTLARAIKAGRMSAASRRDDGSYELDPAEVTRCFPLRPPGNGGATASMTQYATPDATAALADMTAQRDDVKADRDRWRTQAEATQRLLSDATARAAQPWWKRLAG